MTKRLIKILSIDGGGVRSIIPAHIIAELEKRTHKKIGELFDLIAGNSMGGLIAAQLVAPDENGKIKYSAQDIVNNSYSYYPKIFKKSWLMTHFPFLNFFQPKISSIETEKMLNDYFGKTLLSQTVTEVLIPSYEVESDKPYIFKRQQARQDSKFDFHLKDVVMATTSEPTVVSPHSVNKSNNLAGKEYTFLDGGFIANSPALCAYTWAKILFPEATDFLIVSLGTGDFMTKMSSKKIRSWGIINWIPQIIHLLIRGQGAIIDHELKDLLSAPSDQLRHYFRIQFRLKKDEAAGDNANPAHLHKLGVLGCNVVKENEEQIQQICSLLT